MRRNTALVANAIIDYIKEAISKDIIPDNFSGIYKYIFNDLWHFAEENPIKLLDGSAYFMVMDAADAWCRAIAYIIDEFVKSRPNIFETVDVIYPRTFTHTDVKEITLSKNLRYIHTEAFMDIDSNLQTIRYLGSKSDFEDIPKEEEWDLYIFATIVDKDNNIIR